MNTHTAAELILKKHIEGCQWYAPVCDNRVLAAMEEYAASLSAPAPQTEPAGLEFYKWAHKQGLERYPDDLWRYETDMLQAASMDEDESWDNGLSKEEGITTFTDEQVWQKFLSEAAAPVASHSLTSGNPVGQRIYTASKTKHAHLWTELRAQGYNVISTWIDEAGAGQTKDMSDLCRRCIEECMSCDAMLVYSEEGDYLKGAFIEMGVALAANKPIVLVGPVLPSGSAFTHASKIYKAETIQQALSILSEAAAPVSQPAEGEAAPEDWKRLVSKENLMCLLLKYDRDKNKCADKIIKLICAPLHTQLQAAQAENERLKGEAAPQDRRMLLDQIQHILITHRGHAGGASEVYDNIVAPLQSQLQAREKEAAFLNEKINEYSTQLQAAQERVAEARIKELEAEIKNWREAYRDL